MGYLKSGIGSADKEVMSSQELAARASDPQLELSIWDPSTRELEVAQLVANGLSNAQIGKRLFVSEETVKTHMRNLMMKLNAHNRAHVVSMAFRHGLIQ
jgi:DNA-binding NarL/FixJ family response regulator